MEVTETPKEFGEAVKDAIQQAAEFEKQYGEQEAHRRIMLDILKAAGWRFGMSAKQGAGLTTSVAGHFAQFVVTLGKQLNAERARQQG
jgi:hypothetical protein